MNHNKKYRNGYNFDSISNSRYKKQTHLRSKRNPYVGNLDQRSVEKKFTEFSASYKTLNKKKTTAQFMTYKFTAQNDSSRASNPNIELSKNRDKHERAMSQRPKYLKMHSLSLNTIRADESLMDSPRRSPSKLQQTCHTRKQISINKSKNYFELKSTAGSASYKQKIPTFLRTRINQKGQTSKPDLKKGLMIQRMPSFGGQKHSLSRQDFEFGVKIGQGSYGKVFLARQININFLCVVKQISKDRMKQYKIAQNIKRQIKLQSFMKHKNCAQIYGFFDDINYLYIVLQYLPDGDLQKSYISKQKTNDQQLVSQLLLQICQVVKTMHKYEIIHRDIKPQNIFIFGKTVKLGDYGCSVYSGTMRKTVIGTLQYMSPEQLRQERYNKQIDNWSIGILTYELLFGVSPYKDEIIRILCNEHEQRQFPPVQFPILPAISDSAKDFIRRLLTKQSQKRMNMQQALRHEFLQRAVENRITQQNAMKKLSDYLGF